MHIHFDPHAQDWIAAVVLMVMLWRLPKGALRAIEAAFGLQGIVLLLWYSWPLWAAFDKLINLPLETAAICFCRKFPVAQWMLIAHILLKIFLYADMDCDWEFPTGPLPVVIYWLNCLIILVLLAYTFRKENHNGITADHTTHPAKEAV